MKKRKIITISGVDGSGKTTQIYNLQKKLGSKQSVVVISVFSYYLLKPLITMLRKQTGNKKRGPIKRNNSLVLKLWFIPALFDFWIHYYFRILPIASRNDILICDRYFDDIAVNICYYGYMPQWIFPFYIKLLPPKSRGFYLSVDAKTAYKRSGEFEFHYYQEQLALYEFLQKNNLISIPNGPIDKTQQQLITEIQR